MKKFTSRDIVTKSKKIQSKSRPLNLNIFVTILAITIVLILFVSQIFSYSNFVNSKTINNQDIEFEVKENESITRITENLVNQKILQDTNTFGIENYRIYVQLNNIDAKSIKPGKYQIPPGTSIQDIYKLLTPRTCSSSRITLPEGKRVEEFAEIINTKMPQSTEKKFVRNEYINLARNYKAQETGLKFDYKFPENLEGFLFPDTYEVCNDITAKDFIKLQLQNFDKKIYQKYKSDVNKDSIQRLINIASMVERESRKDDEREVIAGIIENRLKTNEPLGIDATSQYGYGYSNQQNSWWVSGAELDQAVSTNDQYNTRKNKGLPPTPISNPGERSIMASLYPAKTDYYFYLHDKNGVIRYARTNAEHEENVRKFLR